jgi:hypothetical protein
MPVPRKWGLWKLTALGIDPDGQSPITPFFALNATFCFAPRIGVTLEAVQEQRDSTVRSDRPRRILLFITVFVTSLFGQTVRTSEKPEGIADPTKPLSVCEVLERRAELMGRFETLRGEYSTAPVERIISVRGEVKFGGHGPYLIAAPSCTFKLTTTSTTWPSGLTTLGATWPNIIWLEYPINTSPFESSHAPFEVDWISVRRAEREELRRGYHSASHQLFETFTGLLVSYDTLEFRAPASPLIMKRGGFGPAGLDAPAKLLIKSIVDAVVIRKPRK